MTAETMIKPRLLSPLCTRGFRRLGIGILWASTSMCFQMMWSSVQTRTPEGPSNLSELAFWPPGTFEGCQQRQCSAKQVWSHLAPGDLPVCLWVHSIFAQRGSIQDPTRRTSSAMLIDLVLPWTTSNFNLPSECFHTPLR